MLDENGSVPICPSSLGKGAFEVEEAEYGQGRPSLTRGNLGTARATGQEREEGVCGLQRTGAEWEQDAHCPAAHHTPETLAYQEGPGQTGGGRFQEGADIELGGTAPA